MSAYTPVLSVAVLLGAALFMAACSSSDSDNFALDGVSISELSSDIGKDLRPPGPEDEPAVGADRARRIAQNQQGLGAEVGDMVLARLHNIGREGPGRLVWIVNFDPATVPPVPPFGWMGPIETHADGSSDYGERVYAVTIVDASMGGVIGTFNKTDPPDYMRID